MLSNIDNYSTEEIERELSELFDKKRKLRSDIDNVDTIIIGYKEELRKRCEKRNAEKGDHLFLEFFDD